MMPGMPMMPQMMQPQMMQQQPPQNDQMQKFMEMQMQLMQNMLSMQQQQMGQTPPPQPPQQQAPDYLSIPVAGHQHRMSMASQGSHFAPSIKSQTPPLANQGRAMTMMHPPTRWDVPPGAQRPNSAMPAYGPSGLQIPNGGPGPGYTPSIAPSERSNVGMPSRYRPVTTGNDGSGRSQTMTSASMLQLPSFNQAPPPPPKHEVSQRSTSTVRVIPRKPAPKVTAKPVADEDDEEGWAEMRKKREAKKKFGFGRRDKHGSTIGDLYHNFD